MGLTTDEFEGKLLEGEPRIAALRYQPQGMTFVFSSANPATKNWWPRRLKEIFTAACRG
jgi:hypothetical protein